MSATVMAIGERRNNAELIADCFMLGYLHESWVILDPTYGEGRFWTAAHPDGLLASDLYKGDRWDGAQWVGIADFTALTATDRAVDAVVFDPPYKLNGTSTGRGAAASDYAYGVDRPATWQERHDLIRRGITEACRVARRYVLIKCQDQVCSGTVRWQTHEFADHAAACGFQLVDKLHVQGSRPQPSGRRQVHARRDYSTLLVTKRAGA